MEVRSQIETHSPDARIVLAESAVLVNNPEMIQGKRVLVVEDGPTLTHGEMPYGAGFIAAEMHRAKTIVDPRSYAVGSLKEIFTRYPHIGNVIPAMGYSPDQIQDLETTINNSRCDLVLFATPIQLKRILDIRKQAFRVRYEYQDHGSPTLEGILARKFST
jgi:predicted GTPase